MRLEAMTVGQLRLVIAIYEREAFGDAAHAPLQLPGGDGDPLTTVLDVFDDETQVAAGTKARRYTLRLGNPRYPFMKLALQEFLVEDEYFFSVDTHDQMFELAGAEARKLADLKRYNLDTKTRIEMAWDDEQIPMAGHIKGLVETHPAPRWPSNGRTILVVDDDIWIASTLAMLLEARGYHVTCLHDGREAIKVADPRLHDLILMDNEMIHLNGFEACRVLKSREETRHIPVLIATAGSLTLRQLDDADGFLVKPFRAELLFTMLHHMLSRKDAL